MICASCSRLIASTALSSMISLSSTQMSIRYPLSNISPPYKTGNVNWERKLKPFFCSS